LEKTLKEKIEEKLFKQKVWQAVIFSQIAIKPIIEKFDNKQELSKRDYKLLNKFKDKTEKLLKEDMPLEYRSRGYNAMLYEEILVLYGGSSMIAFGVGMLGGCLWGENEKEQFLNNTANGDFINNAMQQTHTHNIEQLLDYLSINQDNSSLMNIYDHLSEVIQ